MNCDICEHIAKKEHIIFETQTVAAEVLQTPATTAHVQIYPKDHQPIIEKIEDAAFGDMLVAANKIASLSFDLLGAHGTNILIRNGLAGNQKSSHSCIDVLPRFEHDGLTLHWQTRKASEDELNAVQTAFQEDLALPEKKPEEPKKEEIKEEKHIEKEAVADEDNYLLKQLHRIP